MKAGILYSGGKDSSLAAVLLSREYEVELNTFVFSADTPVTAIREAGNAIGLPHHVRVFRDGLMDEVIDLITRVGFPNGAIQLIHREAIQSLAHEYEVVGDGTRFGDRIPLLTDDEVRSIGDRYRCSYVRPLLGFPKREVIRLAERYFEIEYGETGRILNGDYEREIRQELENRGIRHGPLFPPAHQQSLVRGRRN
jgi:predicted subunit of tRNA(5-methylaminomethyl-2-thiouridylate) methyltransferase